MLVHGTQQGNDVACCSTLEAASLPTFGNPNDGLDVINSQIDWNRLGNSGAFIVQSIMWCGTPGTNIIGCGQTPGNKFAIALDALPSIRGQVIAHERGHNAGLQHRENQSCALMFPFAGATHGCLNTSECLSIRNLGFPGGSCPCHDPTVGNPPLDGATCDDGDGCTQTDTCQSGLCSGSNPVVCTALDQCHDPGVCDPGTGICSDPAKPDGTGCDDGDLCTQTDSCQGGACSGADPVVCTALDQCHDPGVCDPGTGICSDPAKPDGTGCDDGDLCTQTDTCQGGACSGADPVVCMALDACHEPGVCEPATGICDDPAKPDGAVCDDGDPATPEGVCLAGTCTGTLPVPSFGPLGRGLAVLGLLLAALAALIRRARETAG